MPPGAPVHCFAVAHLTCGIPSLNDPGRTTPPGGPAARPQPSPFFAQPPMEPPCRRASAGAAHPHPFLSLAQPPVSRSRGPDRASAGAAHPQPFPFFAQPPVSRPHRQALASAGPWGGSPLQLSPELPCSGTVAPVVAELSRRAAWSAEPRLQPAPSFVQLPMEPPGRATFPPMRLRGA